MKLDLSKHFGNLTKKRKTFYLPTMQFPIDKKGNRTFDGWVDLSEYAGKITITATYPPKIRYNFTVNTGLRKLHFQIIAGNPVSLCTIYEGESMFSFGWSVCHEGDFYNKETGVRKAFENAIEISYGLTKEEKVQMAEKFGAIITKVRNEYN